MSLTAKEKEVVDALRQHRVATREMLCQQVGVSYWTVREALLKCGYYTSFNRNAAYYTLADITVFDTEGLWFHYEIGFSRYRTLERTLKALVEGAAAGYTVRELETRLHTRVGNLLSRACQRGDLARYSPGREAVYLSAVREQQERQSRQRQGEGETGLRVGRLGSPGAPTVPPGLDALRVIAVLLELTKQPQAGAAVQAQALCPEGAGVTPAEVRRVVEFYGLREKGAL